MGSHVYGIECTKHTDKWCYHCVIDWYVAEAERNGINIQDGLLFPKMSNLQQFDLLDGETPHSFKHGGVKIDLIKMGRSLEEVMYKSYCKNPSTAKIYAKGLSVMCSIHTIGDQKGSQKESTMIVKY